MKLYTIVLLCSAIFSSQAMMAMDEETPLQPTNSTYQPQTDPESLETVVRRLESNQTRLTEIIEHLTEDQLRRPASLLERLGRCLRSDSYIGTAWCLSSSLDLVVSVIALSVLLQYGQS